ncbi:MAG: hypothetical protein E6G69_05800 [Alphaproteobacteria bacterium]|jgi:hypothetical protein|nr:MAG: hypothetical protein E6G69_05800 [Alphaproteobacteria bacterium]
MKWMLFAASAAIAAGLWLPGPVTMSYAAQPAAPAETAAPLPATGEDKITFDQYREWRLRFIERRQTQLAAQLAAAELQPRQRARLDQTKAYYDWFAGLSDAERDRRFRERFDQMDSNHDGVVDPAERAAWHDKQRAFFGRGRTAAAEPAAARQPR